MGTWATISLMSYLKQSRRRVLELARSVSKTLVRGGTLPLCCETEFHYHTSLSRVGLAHASIRRVSV